MGEQISLFAHPSLHLYGWNKLKKKPKSVAKVISIKWRLFILSLLCGFVKVVQNDYTGYLLTNVG